MYTDKELSIRPIKNADLLRIWELIYKNEEPEWKKWDAPYYPHHPITYEKFLETKETWIDASDCWAIVVDGVIRGVLTYYWEHEPSKWLEMGIVLHENTSWSKGLGTRAMTLWMKHLFTTMPLERVGFTTWSGNIRMMRVGEKLGMQLEAKIRRVRFYEGVYYDSIRMGILRDEYEQIVQ